MNFAPKQLNQQQFQQKEEEYKEEVIGYKDKMQEAWNDMHSFFENQPTEVDYKYYHSYFRWYTDISWRRLKYKDSKFLEEIAFSRQILMASALGFDIIDDWILSLDYSSYNTNEIQSNYSSFKKAFINSPAILYELDESEEQDFYRVSDLIDDLSAQQRKDDPSLYKANLFTDIKDNILNNSKINWLDYIQRDVESILDNIDRVRVYYNDITPEQAPALLRVYFSGESTEAAEMEAKKEINSNTDLDQKKEDSIDESESEQPSSFEEPEGTTKEKKDTEPTKTKATKKQKVEDILEEEPDSESKQKEAQQTKQTETEEESGQEEPQEEAKQTETKEGKPEQETTEGTTEELEEAKEEQETKKEDIDREKEELSEQKTGKTEPAEEQQMPEETSSVQDILEEETEQETSQAEQQKEKASRKEQTTEQEKPQAKQKEEEDTKEEAKKNKERQEEVRPESTEEDQKTEQKQEEALSRHAKQAQQNIEEHKGMSDKEIKDEVESQFGRIENLDPTNIDSFRRVLKNIARQEDREEEVSDWFYFDQESSKFKWNI